MSRVTAPISKLSRGLGTSSVASPGAVARPLRDTTAHSAGAALMPKYAELLRNRRSGDLHDSSRSLTTTHRPTPQPSLANRSKPLMQTFHSMSPTTIAPVSPANLDATVLPSIHNLLRSDDSSNGPRVPILPDNYSVAHGPFPVEDPVQLPDVSIVASDPENVLPGAPLSEVEGISLDGVELKFVHENLHGTQPPGDEVAGSGMIRDLWRSMVDDVFGPVRKAT
ncbi:hypothetical protein XA68_14737 [Ophiocordyceps unilateralis]|uniref:Uncharacterized protein n=1 Tax=Ophiocordyceps unilateralis TaxID=268505 RepID=A0A2A9PN08_OPHUN|nr:hypothetical protein XA68_14737 [Ophiocordyceps unilateralis]